MKLITTKDYLLWVDEEQDIHKDCFVYRKSRDEISFATFTTSGQKIIAYLPRHKDAPKLEGVLLLPELPKQEDDVEQLAKQLYPRKINDPYNPQEDDNKEYRDIWIAGYKANTGKWSDEQVLIAIAEGRMAGQRLTNKTDNEIFQSLSPATLPVDFEPEYCKKCAPDEGCMLSNQTGGNLECDSTCKAETLIKKIKNEQEIPVIQGRWIYE